MHYYLNISKFSNPYGEDKIKIFTNFDFDLDFTEDDVEFYEYLNKITTDFKYLSEFLNKYDLTIVLYDQKQNGLHKNTNMLLYR